MKHTASVIIVMLTVLLLLGGCGSVPAASPSSAPSPAAALSPQVTAPPHTTAQPSVPSQPTTTAVAQATGTLLRETMTSEAVATNLLGDPAKRGYNIYLPPSYSAGNKRYPVVYILHGWGHDENNLLVLKNVYETLLRKGTVQEIILVFANGFNKLGGSNYLSSPTIGDYETYIAKELVAHIDGNYRTLPTRDSRAITGCSMGGDGAMHLALTFPDVYTVAAPMSATYDFANDPFIPKAAARFTKVPQNFNEYAALAPIIRVYISIAAGAAPNPNNPPFYLDMPFEVVDGQGRVVPEVWQKIAAVDVVHDLEEYLRQPVRLNHILLYHGKNDRAAPVELAQSFDRLLTTRGVDHQYVEVEIGGHCDYDMAPVMQYLSDHLIVKQP